MNYGSPTIAASDTLPQPYRSYERGALMTETIRKALAAIVGVTIVVVATVVVAVLLNRPVTIRNLSRNAEPGRQ